VGYFQFEPVETTPRRFILTFTTRCMRPSLAGLFNLTTFFTRVIPRFRLPNMSESIPESSKRSRSPSSTQDHPNKKQTGEAPVVESSNASGAQATAPQLTEEEAAMSGSSAPVTKVPFKKGKNARAPYLGKKNNHWDAPRTSQNTEPKKEGSDDEEGGDGSKRLPKKKAAIMLGWVMRYFSRPLPT